jgi:hypothetical protein
MRYFDGHKLIYANGAESLLRGFVGEANEVNINKLSQRFRIAPDLVRKGLAARPATASFYFETLVSAKRTAPAKPATVADLPTRRNVRGDVRADDVAASWRAEFGRVIQD